MSAYQITPELAQQLVEFVSGETGFNMIICDKNGTIIGDNRKERFGIRHESSVKILKGEAKEIAITMEDQIRTGGTIRMGYHCGIMIDGEIAGTFGIGGDIAVVKPLAKVAAAMIAARVKEAKHMDLIRQVVTEVSQNVHQAAAAIQQVSASSEELASASQTVTEAAIDADDKVKATNKILDFIRSVSDQTKLLGLNAAIEAARAGDHGRGFNVVAEEVRKLASNSASSVEQINTILKDIQLAIAKVSSSSKQTSAISSEQSRAMQDIARVIESIQNSVNLLVASVGN